MHLRFDAIAKMDGGKSQVRIWQNGKLILDESRVKTLARSTDSSELFYLFSYWNGGAPKSQSVWIDNLRLSSFRPVWVADLQAVDQY